MVAAGTGVRACPFNHPFRRWLPLQMSKRYTLVSKGEQMPESVNRPNLRAKQAIRILAALCLTIVGAATLLEKGHAQNTQLERPACQKCWETCVDARDSCINRACTASGGANTPSSCVGVKNQKLYSDGLAACSKQEGVCTDKCYVAGGTCGK